MANLFYLPKAISLPGSKLTFTQTGTTTPQSTYQDAALTTPHANPVVADSAGVFAPIYLDSTLPNYRVRHATSADVLIYQVDDVLSNQTGGTSLELESTLPFLQLYDTDGTSNLRKYRIRASGASFEILGLNDAESIEDVFFSYGGTAPSFTATLSGFGSTVTGSVFYRRTGKTVTLWAQSNITGTSNTTAMSLTGLPSQIAPSSSKIVPCTGVYDNSVLIHAACDIGPSSISFSVNTVSGSKIILSSTGFANSGTKGIGEGWSVTYPVS